LTLVCNPTAARSNKFWRTRSWIYLSRKVLERKYITADERAFDFLVGGRRLLIGGWEDHLSQTSAL
jgi:hypothetical protein